MKHLQRLFYGVQPGKLQKRLIDRARRSFSATGRNVIVTHHEPNAASSLSIRTDDDATSLVDMLLVHTRELMRSSRHHVVAYSGGVDSSLVAALLQQLADEHNRIQAVLGISPAVSREQVRQAQEVAALLQVDLVKVETTEQSDPVYIENRGLACLACKTHLYTAMTSVVEYMNTQQENNNYSLYNGTNSDDLQDDTRVGLIAARNFDVKSPLSQTSKQDVRRAVRWLGLPNHNAAASPCLRSRLALGMEATQEHLRRIEQAERKVRHSLSSLEPSHNLRVRMLAKQQAMIEIDAELVHDVERVLSSLLEPYMLDLGFRSVAVRPFKSGSVARKQSSNTFETTVTTTTTGCVAGRSCLRE